MAGDALPMFYGRQHFGAVLKRRLFVRRVLLIAMLLSSLLPSATPAVSARAGASMRTAGVVPGGFSDSLVSDKLSVPVALIGLPDGRALVLQKGGQVRVVQYGALVASPALSLEVCSQSERGLLGVAADPDFGSNGFLFLYYTRVSAGVPGGCVNRVSRFTMVGNTISSASELVLLDNIGSPGGNHNGGDVAIGNDGFLYVSVGDGGCDPRENSGCAGGNDAAQDLSLLNGKILRVNRSTGAPAAGNPFTGGGTAVCRTRGNTPSTPTSTCQEIFAYGLRNPWRIAFDPNTGANRFFINDVGQGAREEVDQGVVGANYGWPAREGQCAQGAQTPCAPPAMNLGYTQPLTDYSHDDSRPLDFGGEYITGGAFVPNGAWGKVFDGGYLFADGSPGRIMFKPAVGSTNYNIPLTTGVPSISDIGFVMEPSGWALYYVLPGADEVRKVVYATTPAAASIDLAYVPVTPSDRPFDSRNAGSNSGVVRAGTSRLVKVVGTIGAHRAALVNITLIGPTSDAFATA